MRKISILLFALLMSVSIFSQEEFRKNEIKANLGSAILFYYPEISYERILTDNMSVGTSVGFSLKEYQVRRYNFTPYFRYHFGEVRPATGFFIELNTELYSHREGVKTHGEVTGHSTDVGIGIGAGWKYQTRSNWVGEFLIGGGYQLNYVRFGITFGRRF